MKHVSLHLVYDNFNRFSYSKNQVICAFIFRYIEYTAYIGNYIREFLYQSFELGFHVITKNLFGLKERKKFDMCYLRHILEQTVHKFLWSLAYADPNKIEVYVGSQHVVVGRKNHNYIQFLHKLYGLHKGIKIE